MPVIRGNDPSLGKSGEGLRDTPWRDAASYDYTRRLTRRDWAWEFLRRNKHYAMDWKLVQNEVGLPSKQNRFVVLRLGAGVSRMLRWGLIFR